MALIDLDHFKLYNDQNGHQAGDRLLKSVAAAWRDMLRAGDVLARYGGEEFAVALPGCSLEDGAALVARLREVIPGIRPARPVSPSGTARRTARRSSAGPTQRCTRRRPPAATA